ncbi:hypothetical protein RUM44_003442 [Polyplax serrata]|uniref:IGFBP N-terminal domain-containing protein n=1 Tax=Polyplax serrata TaxID=468196 RepID=A0ABR1AGI5_POLSC
MSFSCVCSPSECEDVSKDDCPGGGTVWDPCKCCRVCARIDGEPCGGPHGFYGTCADGLDCIVATHASGKPVLAANSEGICTPANERKFGAVKFRDSFYFWCYTSRRSQRERRDHC